MSRLRAIIVYSNLWVGMACAALSLLHMPASAMAQKDYPIFVLFATAAAYNYMRLVQRAEPNTQLNGGYGAWVTRNIQWVSFLGALFSALTAFFLLRIWSPRLMSLLVFPAVLSILYPITFKSKGAYFSVRMWPGVKIFLISVVWAYTLVLMPTALYDRLELASWLDFLMTGLFVAGLTIPFDVRDMHIDDPAMRTLPAVLGQQKALSLAVFLLGLVQLYVFVAFIFLDWGLAKSLGYLIAIELGIYLIKHMHSSRDEFYTSFWIEGVPVYAFLIYWIIKQFLYLL